MENSNDEKVKSRLWSLDDEYERLKPDISDHKILLAALKQQTDLLVQISRQGEHGENINEWEIEYDPKLAAQELKELFKKLEPLLIN